MVSTDWELSLRQPSQNTTTVGNYDFLTLCAQNAPSGLQQTPEICGWKTVERSSETRRNSSENSPNIHYYDVIDIDDYDVIDYNVYDVIDYNVYNVIDYNDFDVIDYNVYDVMK